MSLKTLAILCLLTVITSGANAKSADPDKCANLNRVVLEIRAHGPETERRCFGLSTEDESDCHVFNGQKFYSRSRYHRAKENADLKSERAICAVDERTGNWVATSARSPATARK